MVDFLNNGQNDAVLGGGDPDGAVKLALGNAGGVDLVWSVEARVAHTVVDVVCHDRDGDIGSARTAALEQDDSYPNLQPVTHQQ